jgi:hypothetical protein
VLRLRRQQALRQVQQRELRRRQALQRVQEQRQALVQQALLLPLFCRKRTEQLQR